MLWNAARLVSLGAGGLLADAIGIRGVYVSGGFLLLIAAAIGWGAPLHQRQTEPWPLNRPGFDGDSVIV